MKFKYNPRLIEQLGTELITSDEIAIVELVKNSYDANARHVDISFFDDIKEVKNNLRTPINSDVNEKIQNLSSGNLILLEDDGDGMNEVDIKNGFFVLGSEVKKEKKKNIKKNERVPLGDKGLGRLSAQRLAPILVLETKEETGPISLVVIDWAEFISNEDYDTPCHSIKTDSAKSYTRIWLLGVQENPVTFNKIIVKEDGNRELSDELQAAINFLTSPFEEGLEDFKISFYLNGVNLKYEIDKDILKLAESVHQFNITNINGVLYFHAKLEIKPWFIQRIHYNELKKFKSLFKDYKKESLFYMDLYDKYKPRFINESLKATYDFDKLISIIKIYFKKFNIDADTFTKHIKKISPIKSEIYSYKRKKNAEQAIEACKTNNIIKSDSKIDSERVTLILEAHNGVKLYREKNRVGTLGNKDNDWLKFQQKQTTGQQHYRFNLANVLGHVSINDKFQKYIEEISSRQGIKENEYSTDLKILLDYILNSIFYGFTRTANNIIKDILNEEGLIPTSRLKDIQNEVSQSEENLIKTKANFKRITSIYSSLNSYIELDSPDKINKFKTKFLELGREFEKMDGNTTMALNSIDSTRKLADIIELEKNRIELESYNNYKLMANGLITEAISHEIHSIVKDGTRSSEEDGYKAHIREIENYLLDNKKIGLIGSHLVPLKKELKNLYLGIGRLDRFYEFLEKTFLYNGTHQDFEVLNLYSFLESMELRFEKELSKEQITFDFEKIKDITLELPRGSLVHVFYNLMENSIYWIRQRIMQSSYDKLLKRENGDKIIVRKINKKEKDGFQYLDTGLGVIKKMEHLVFLPLESGKEKGRGMGMYIVRMYLESFGASISLLEDRNQYGNKYIFEIKLNN